MPRLIVQKLSVWDVAYAIDMAVAAVVTYCLMTFVAPLLVNRPTDAVGVLWAVISTVFVFRDTRAHSWSAGLARLFATFVSFVLCLIYLALFPVNALAMLVLLTIGTLLMMALGRRDDIGLTAITTAVVVIVAASASQAAWQQPLLRLIDTVVGIAVGVACKWIASSLFYRAVGAEVQ
jgi:uncharacterized membrane protein YgaE (UPF0421/DUF939 family)